MFADVSFLMQPLARTKRRGLVYCALAGLETGVLGGVLVLGWWAFSALAAGQPVWAIPARLGACFCRGVVSRNELAVAGVALQISSAGTIGALFGLAVRGSWSLQRVVLFGLATGLGWHYAGYEVLLRTVGLTAYSVPPRRTMLMGHLLFGLSLGMYRRFLGSLQTGPRAHA
jgi:hypothetical protein